MKKYGIDSWWKRRLLKKMLKHDVPAVSIAEAHKVMSEKIFLDSRETEEYEVSHLPKATFVGFNDFNISSVEKIKKDAAIIVYCSVGLRSEKITRLLISEGYSNVQNLYGGIFEWKNQGHEIVDAAESPTEKIHAFNKKFGMWIKKGEKVF
ncbi:MAG: rhodanese-like domain-containing protein [Ferruginibacter sp.]